MGTKTVVIVAVSLVVAVAAGLLTKNTIELSHENAALRQKVSDLETKVALQEAQNLAALIEVRGQFDARMKPVGQLEFADGEHLMLLAPLKYKIGNSDQQIIIPAGFVHDRASVPQWLRSLMSHTGEFALAAIVHDYLYWAQPCTKTQADNLMYIAMLESKVGPADRLKISTALSVAGSHAFNSNRRARGSGDFRVVPEHHRDLAAGESWAPFHARLKALGVSDPGFEQASSFCAIGDRRDVPKAT